MGVDDVALELVPNRSYCCHYRNRYLDLFYHVGRVVVVPCHDLLLRLLRSWVEACTPWMVVGDRGCSSVVGRGLVVVVADTPVTDGQGGRLDQERRQDPWEGFQRAPCWKVEAKTSFCASDFSVHSTRT